MPFRRFRLSSTTSTTSPHEFYSLACDCGNVVEGEREKNAQRIRCPVCDALFYVLPRDVYPTPQIVETPPPEPVAKTITFASVEEPAAKAKPQPQTEEENWLSPDDEYVEQRLAEPVDHTPKRVWLERPSGKTIRKQLFRVSIAAGVLLLLTAWWVSHRNHVREAERAFQEHYDQAISYTDEGHWKEALEEAQLGVEAARFLDRHDATSTELFNLWKELDILQHLSSLTPIEIVLQKQNEQFTHEDWMRQFRIRHSGTWVILDATVKREVTENPESSKDEEKPSTTYQFEFPVGLEGEDVRFVWSIIPEWFTRLSYQDQQARVLVAAKLQSVRYPEKDSETWEMVLAGEDAHLWTNSQMLDKALGITSISDVNRELNTLIQSQKELVQQAEATE